jgi:hypothetical protein
LLQLTKPRHGAAIIIIRPSRAFRYYARHRLVITRNDDFLALRYATEQLPEPSLRLENAYLSHLDPARRSAQTTDNAAKPQRTRCYCPFFASDTALSTPACISFIAFWASPGFSSHFDISVAMALRAPSYLAISCWL